MTKNNPLPFPYPFPLTVGQVSSVEKMASYNSGVRVGLVVGASGATLIITILLLVLLVLFFL